MDCQARMFFGELQRALKVSTFFAEIDGLDLPDCNENLYPYQPIIVGLTLTQTI
jgi:hypothetical protein